MDIMCQKSFDEHPDISPNPIVRQHNWQHVDESNGWVNGVNVCDKCSNNPKNGGSGICCCAIPSLYGPLRVTC